VATTLASLVVRIGADVTGVTAGLNTLDKRTRKLKKQFTSVTDSTLTWQGALGVLAGATGLAFVAKKVFDLGAGVEETASKFNTVFGPSVQGAQKFLDEFANTAGLTVTEGRELLATTGAIVQGMGMSQAASSEFAQEIVRLSGDFSSFNNIPIAETSRAIQSALTGERESLKRLGIVILEADVQKKALAMTGKEVVGSLTQQEKATATLTLITERAGVAVGDLARTMDSPANKARKLAAQVLTVRDSLAHALLPAMAVVLEELGAIGGDSGFAGLSHKIRQADADIAAWAKFAVETFKTVALAIAAPVRIAFNLGEVLGKVLVAAAQAMTGNFEGARETLGSMVGDFGDMRDAITNVIAGFDNMRVASGAAWQTVPTPDVIAPIVQSTDALGLSIDNLAKRTFDLDVGLLPLPELLKSAGQSALKAGEEFDFGAAMMRRLGDEIGDIALAGVDAFADFAEGAGDAIGNFVKAAISDLARLAAKMLIIRGIMSALPGVGSFLGFDRFLGGFAHGGTIPAGKFGLVAEAGMPEVISKPSFVQGPAHVTPMGAGGGVTLNVNIEGPQNVVEMERDQKWLRSLNNSILNLEQAGATR
jgi:hypothetical protein